MEESSKSLDGANGSYDTVHEKLEKREDPIDNSQINQFLKACREGDVKVIDELCNEVDINYGDVTDEHVTPLIISCKLRHLGAVQRIIQHADVNINACDVDGWNATHHASNQGSCDILLELLTHDGRVNSRTHDTEDTPLTLACAYGDDENKGRNADFTACVRILLERGADVNICDDEGWSPLLCACCYADDPSVAKMLLFHGARVNVTDTDGYAPLSQAARRGYLNTVKLLLYGVSDHGLVQMNRDSHNEGDNVNKIVKNKNNLLTLTSDADVKNHSSDVSQDLFIDTSQPPQNMESQTDIVNHEIRGKFDVFYDVTRTIADVNHKTSDCTTAVYLAAENGHLDCIRVLLAAGAECDVAEEEDGWTPLMVAAYKKQNEIVMDLLQAGADVHHTSIDGENAVLLASHAGCVHTLQTLLGAGGRIVADNDKCTPLHLASKGGHLSCVSLLLQPHQELRDVNARDREGATPLFLAAQAGYSDCVSLLLQSGADPKISGPGGCCPLHAACANTDIKCIRMLLPLSDINAVDDEGKTPLYLACECTYVVVKCAAALLEAGADLDIKSNKSWSVVQVAAENGSMSLIRLLLQYKPAVKWRVKQNPIAILEKSGRRGNELLIGIFKLFKNNRRLYFKRAKEREIMREANIARAMARKAAKLAAIKSD